MKNKSGGQKRFIKLCSTLKDEQLLTEIFNLFFTEEEKDDLGKRYLIVEALLKGSETQREIAKNLNVSIAKITRGSNELKRSNPKLLAYLTKNL